MAGTVGFYDHLMYSFARPDHILTAASAVAIDAFAGPMIDSMLFSGTSPNTTLIGTTAIAVGGGAIIGKIATRMLMPKDANVFGFSI
jgi:hypothetical protein